MATILQTRDLTYTYSAGTPFERTAIDHINLSIEAGDFVALIGHTGSGKSTLIQHFNGLLKPSAGEVLLDGKSIWNSRGKCPKEVRFAVGLVFQYPEYQLFEETIAKDIAFGPKNMGLSESEIDQRVTEAMQAVGLPFDLKDTSPFALSGGQKRRVAIAGVLSMRPKVLVLDEPMAGLDPQGRDEILAFLKQYHKQTGATIVLVTHSMEDAARVAKRMIVLSNANVLMTGTPHEVFAKGEELKAAGLDIPEITQVFHKLYAKGLVDTPAVLTIEEALAVLGRKGANLC